MHAFQYFYFVPQEILATEDIARDIIADEDYPNVSESATDSSIQIRLKAEESTITLTKRGENVHTTEQEDGVDNDVSHCEIKGKDDSLEEQVAVSVTLGNIIKTETPDSEEIAEKLDCPNEYTEENRTSVKSEFIENELLQSHEATKKLQTSENEAMKALYAVFRTSKKQIEMQEEHILSGHSTFRKEGFNSPTEAGETNEEPERRINDRDTSIEYKPDDRCGQTVSDNPSETTTSDKPNGEQKYNRSIDEIVSNTIKEESLSDWDIGSSNSLIVSSFGLEKDVVKDESDETEAGDGFGNRRCNRTKCDKDNSFTEKEDKSRSETVRELLLQKRYNDMESLMNEQNEGLVGQLPENTTYKEKTMREGRETSENIIPTKNSSIPEGKELDTMNGSVNKEVKMKTEIKAESGKTAENVVSEDDTVKGLKSNDEETKAQETVSQEDEKLGTMKIELGTPKKKLLNKTRKKMSKILVKRSDRQLRSQAGSQKLNVNQNKDASPTFKAECAKRGKRGSYQVSKEEMQDNDELVEVKGRNKWRKKHEADKQALNVKEPTIELAFKSAEKQRNRAHVTNPMRRLTRSMEVKNENVGLSGECSLHSFVVIKQDSPSYFDQRRRTRSCAKLMKESEELEGMRQKQGLLKREDHLGAERESRVKVGKLSVHFLTTYA